MTLEIDSSKSDTCRTIPATARDTLAALDAVGVGACLLDPRGTVLHANDEWLRAGGFVRGNTIGKGIWELFPDTPPELTRLHDEVRAGTTIKVPPHRQHVVGREVWYEGSLAPVHLEDGVGILITAVDITERKRSAEELSASEERLRLAVEAANIAIWDYTPRTGSLRFSAGRMEAFGMPVESTVDFQAFLEHVLPEDRPRVQEAVLRAMDPQGDGSYRAEYRWRRPDGHLRWVAAAAKTIFEELDAGRAASRLIGTAVDITDQKQAEARMRRIYDAELLGMMQWKIDGEVTDCNDRFLTMTGYTREDLRGERINWAEMTPREWWPRDELARQEVRATGTHRTYEKEWIRKDGSRISILIGAAAFDEDRSEGISFALDITDRKRAEEAVRASEKKFAAIYDHAPYAIALISHPEGILTAVNDAWERMFGFGREEAIGKTAVDLNLATDPAERRKMYAELGRIGAIRNHEMAYANRSGDQRLASFSFDLIEIEGRTFLLGTAIDITDRKRAEAALLEADRRKDEFLAMLGHELRNPLAPIRNAAYILERADPNGEQAERSRGVLRRQIEHLTRLVDDLLDVTRITRGKIVIQKSRIDLRDLVMRAADDIRPVLARRGVGFRVDVPTGEVWAFADPTRLNQVVANLLSNSAKFTRRGDQVRLALDLEDDATEIRVLDTGAGIDPGVLPHIFDPFVQSDRTLARSEGGLGLGLALVKGIAELHGGAVHAESAGVGKGSEFVVRLPLQEVDGPGARADSSSRPAPPVGRRVLVVEDNRDAADSLADLLRMNGYAVVVAHDGPTALEKLESHRPEVVLCDIGLPGMNGYEVARAMRAQSDRAMKLVALSGYAQAEDVKRAMEAGFDAHLAKPLEPGELVKLLA